MGLHQEVRVSRPAGRGLEHGRSPSELYEKLHAIYPFFHSLSLEPLATME